MRGQGDCGSPRPTGLAEKLAALFLLIVSALLFARLVVAVPLSHTWLLDLDPRPDGEEYFAGAVSMARDGTFAMHVTGEYIPPRYPFGYSALMVPFLWARIDPIIVPFIVNRLIGAALIGGIFLWLWLNERPAAAGLAALLLVTLPAFVIVCRGPLSEVSASAIVLAGLVCLKRCTQSERLVVGAVGAWLLGISVCFRVVDVWFAAAIPLTAFAATRVWRERATTTLLLSAALIVGAAPLLWFNWRHLGSPFRFGYALWVPSLGTLTTAFSSANLGTNLTAIWHELTQTEPSYNTANLFGNGSYYGPAFVALAGIAALRYARSSAFCVYGLPAVLYAVMMLLYGFEDQRLMFPVLLLAVPTIAISSVETIARAGTRPTLRSGGAALGVVVLLAAAVAGYPGYRGHVELQDLLIVSRFEGLPRAYTAINDLNLVVTGRRMLVLTDINSAFVYALTSGDRKVASLKTDPPELPYRYTTDDRARLLRWALQDGSVYAAVVATAVSEVPAVCPAPQGFEWHTIIARDDKLAVAELRVTR
jgi:hypothetical protein